MGGTEVNGSQSDHIEVDEVEEQLGRLGSYGNVPEVPVANSARSVFFVSVAGAGDADGSTAGNALLGSDSVITDNATADVRDIFVFLAGNYNINGAVGGLAISVAGVKAFGLGQTITSVENSNASATAVFSMTAAECEMAGFFVNETTNTVEGCIVTGSACHIHDNWFSAGENGIRVNAVTRCVISHNVFDAPTNDGIELIGATTFTRIFDNDFLRCVDNGISLNGDDVDTNHVHTNRINGNNGATDYAVQILLGDNNVVSDNWFGQLGTWPVNNTGSNNIFADNHDGGAYTSTHDITTANDKSETTITGLDDLDLWTNGHVYISIDVQELIDAGEGGVCTVLLKEKIDNTNYRPVKINVFDVAGGDTVHPTLDWGFEGGDAKARATIQCTDDVTATRTVTWKFKMV